MTKMLHGILRTTHSLAGHKMHLPKDVPSDTNKTLRAQLRRETPCIVEVVIDKRREMHEVLMGIVNPRPRRKCKDSRVLLDYDSNQLDWPRTQESSHYMSASSLFRSKRPGAPSSGIGQLAIHRVQNRPQEDTILQTNVHEHGGLRLVDRCVQHVGDADGRRRSGESLQTEGLERAVWVKRDDSDGLVFTANSLEQHTRSVVT